MEIQLQLDDNGRTTWIKEGQNIDSDFNSMRDSRNLNDADSSVHQDIDYSTKSVTTSLASKQDNDELMDDLLFDCEVSVEGGSKVHILRVILISCLDC